MSYFDQFSELKRENNFDVVGNVAVVDADLLDHGTRHPNLAVMKMAGYLKERGCTVHLVEDYSELFENEDYSKAAAYDAIYISKVFDFTAIDDKLIRLPNVYIGGTGFFFDQSPLLPECVEHHMPDYTIYEDFIKNDPTVKESRKKSWYKDYLGYSIGFATRGCFRQCEFCVNHNLKKVVFHSHISEWYDPSRRYIYLWDDNILGYPHWKDVFDELEATGRAYQFRQGMDIRLLTPEKAQILAGSHHHGDFIFAFDHIEDATIMEEKLTLWRKYCEKPTKLYVLCGFDGQDENEIRGVFERIRILLKYGCYPYIMRHEWYERSPYKGMFVQLARWCNQPQFLKKLSFRQYCEQCQKYHKTGLSAPMRALTDFEEKFPEIAKEYFDISYLDQPFVKDLLARREQKRIERKLKKEEKKKS